MITQTMKEEQQNIEEIVVASPTFSIIIPAYNSSEYILDTLKSIFAQTFKNYEIILVNDGSDDTEKLEEVIAPYIDKITYLKQENKGIALTRNHAIEKAKGDYLAFLDSDDIWLPNYLEKQLKALQEKKCDLIYADAFLFGEGIEEGAKFSDKAPSVGEVSTESLINGECCPIISGTIVSRQKVVENELFDANVPWMGMEDFDLWFRLSKNGAKLDYQKEPLLKYRVHSDSVSGNRLSILERAFISSKHLEKTYDLNESEKVAVQNAKIDAETQINTEKAKIFLIQENFPKAINYFEKANKLTPSTKLKLVISILKVSPKFLLTVLKKIQPDEYSSVQINRK